MKQFAITALLVLTGMGAQAQTSETRKSQSFNALEVKNGIEVVFTQSKDTSLKVESDSKANLENIVTEFTKGTLKIYLRESANGEAMHGTAKVYVSAEDVDSFKAATGASIKASGKLSADEITVKLASGATFTGEANCSKKLTVKAESGSMFRGMINTAEFDGKALGGTIKITGSAETTNVICNNGSLIAGKFFCQEAYVKTINASTAFVNAVKSISADADNSSSITYYGAPSTVNLGTNVYAIKRDNLKLALNN
ncbi:GIN domain-containing protein [Flavobacterium hauense]